MKRFSVKITSCLLLAVMLLSIGASPAVAATTATVPETIRVGLAYGTGALPGANLENSVGSGYRLGYTADGMSFVQLAYTTETKLSIVKDQNVYFDGKNYVDSAAGAAVGGYHLQLPTAYTVYEEARAAAMQIGGYPAWVAGAYYARVGAYLTAEEAAAALLASSIADATVVSPSSSGFSVVKTGTSTILFQYDSGTAGGMLMVQPGLDDSLKNATWFAGNKYYGALRYQRQGEGNLTVVNILGREDYINCVISREMSRSWPVEALKAQAICARSYAATCATRHQSQGFDLCSTTHCQAYYGMSEIGDNTIRAANETAGQYLWYNGEIVETYYFSSDGGATEDSKNVWGGNKPYLVGVVDPWEGTVANKISNYNWTVTYTKAQLEQKLQENNRPCTDLAGVEMTYTAMGNVKSIKFIDASGKSWTMTGDAARVFVKPSNGSMRFTLSKNGGSAGGFYVNASGDTISTVSGAYAVDGSGNVSPVGEGAYVITGSGTEQIQAAPPSIGVTGDTYTFTGSGWGHNVGMSQWGAYAMAQAGKTYTEILKFYFTGVEVR